jgi:Sulfocyanin (SoxE) domain
MRLRCSRVTALYLLLAASPAAVTSLAAQVGTSTEPAPWVKGDPAARTTIITLEATSPPDSPSALLNGFREGAVQVVVPLGWTVTWEWRNADSSGKHSLVWMVEREKVPTEGGQAAFTNAMTRNVTAGLPAGQSDRGTFLADQAGWFWLLCGVPGHALAGEWIGLRVDPEAKTAGVKRKA